MLYQAIIGNYLLKNRQCCVSGLNPANKKLRLSERSFGETEFLFIGKTI